MSSPGIGLSNILEAEGVIRGSSGWTASFGGSTDGINEVGIIDSGGAGGEVKVAIDYPSVQMIVQGSSGNGGYIATVNKAREIYNTLMGIDTPNADYDELVSCVALNFPAWLGRGDQGQPRFFWKRWIHCDGQ